MCAAIKIRYLPDGYLLLICYVVACPRYWVSVEACCPFCKACNEPVGREAHTASHRYRETSAVFFWTVRVRSRSSQDDLQMSPSSECNRDFSPTTRPSHCRTTALRIRTTVGNTIPPEQKRRIDETVRRALRLNHSETQHTRTRSPNLKQWEQLVPCAETVSATRS